MLGHMTETPIEKNPSTQYGHLLDFVVNESGDKRFDIEVAVMNDGKVVVFHSHPFRSDISWFEFNLTTNKLDFILDDGDVRDIGLPLKQELAKNMQNSHQILMVLMDPKTGDAQVGQYVPLILHRS